MEKLRVDRVLLREFPEPKAEVSCVGKANKNGQFPENWALLGAGAIAVRACCVSEVWGSMAKRSLSVV